MAQREKRSISMPPDVAAMIDEAAAAEGTTFSAWLAELARRHFKIQAGLEAVAAFEAEHGAFTAEELVQAELEVRWLLGETDEPPPKRADR